MRTVEDTAGRRYLLLKRSEDASLVRDVETGEERYVPTEELAVRDGVDPLASAAGAVPAPLRRLVTAVHDDRGLGLAVELAREPRSARALLEATDLCESDLLGLLSELRAAGLLREATVDGERGYAVTEDGRRAVASLTAADGVDTGRVADVGGGAPDAEDQSADASSSGPSD